MRKPDLAGLSAFIAVAQERSFTRAAARLDVTPSTLSHAMRDLEAQLGIRLLNRTTRTVSPTSAGEHLLRGLSPAFGEIATTLDGLNEFRDKPMGTVRINASRMAIELVLAPHFGRFARDYPGITLEVVADEGFIDIVEEGFDMGIRLGDDLQKDMLQVRAGPDLRMAIVATPAYFTRNGLPETPQELQQHRCIGWRRVSTGALYQWEFQREGRAFSVAVDGPLVLDDARSMLDAALADVGIAFALEAQVARHVSEGRLVRILEDWCPPFPGFHLYYPNRRNHPAALASVIDALRFGAS